MYDHLGFFLFPVVRLSLHYALSIHSLRFYLFLDYHRVQKLYFRTRIGREMFDVIRMIQISAQLAFRIFDRLDYIFLFSGSHSF